MNPTSRRHDELSSLTCAELLALVKAFGREIFSDDDLLVVREIAETRIATGEDAVNDLIAATELVAGE